MLRRVSCVALALCGSSAAAVAESPVLDREELRAVEALLDRVVAQASQPGLLLAPGLGARGYHLQGYGTVFVLAPRLLPGEPEAQRRRVVFGRRAGSRVELRARIETRDSGAEAPGPARPAPEAAQGEPLELEVLERQLELLRVESEQIRREAEQQFQRVMQDVQDRLGAPPAPEAAPTAPAPPPWHHWFEIGRVRDERAPERVIADVQTAVLTALERQGSRLRWLAPEESVTVAVDFVPGLLVAGPHAPRTLVVRVRKRDLDERVAGRLGAEELRARVEVVEY
jgi:hypothetical protein